MVVNGKAHCGSDAENALRKRGCAIRNDIVRMLTTSVART